VTVTAGDWFRQASWFVRLFCMVSATVPSYAPALSAICTTLAVNQRAKQPGMSCPAADFASPLGSAGIDTVTQGRLRLVRASMVAVNETVSVAPGVSLTDDLGAPILIDHRGRSEEAPDAPSAVAKSSSALIAVPTKTAGVFEAVLTACFWNLVVAGFHDDHAARLRDPRMVRFQDRLIARCQDHVLARFWHRRIARPQERVIARLQDRLIERAQDHFMARLRDRLTGPSSSCDSPRCSWSRPVFI
jgi:hypothetical protein